MQSLTKREKKIASMGASRASRRLREKSRAGRMVGVPVALAIAKADAVAGDMVPSFELPVIGPQKLTTIAGYAGCVAYMLSTNPGTGMTALGLSSLALAARGQ